MTGENIHPGSASVAVTVQQLRVALSALPVEFDDCSVVVEVPVDGVADTVDVWAIAHSPSLGTNAAEPGTVVLSAVPTRWSATERPER